MFVSRLPGFRRRGEASEWFGEGRRAEPGRGVVPEERLPAGAGARSYKLYV